GDIERALRHAPTVGGDSPGPARIDTGSRLGSRDPRYSLGDLLNAGGVRSVWLGGGDVWAELAAAYHRVAREALARGGPPRGAAGGAAARGDPGGAAFVYGVRRHDLRRPAAARAAGGLPRDAAVLYRDRLNDPRAAAAAFERAGDWDEAVRLYRQSGQYVQAG